MGPSGSGKSTLLQCAAGLEQPTDGRIVLAGVDIGRQSEKERTQLRRDHVGFVFQASSTWSSP
jgi:putative ABC transport system ATP-binding protein